MTLKLTAEPKLLHPDLIAGWNGLASIGLSTAHCLHTSLQAAELGTIELDEAVYYEEAIFEEGILKPADLPSTRNLVVRLYYAQNVSGRDLIIVEGIDQPNYPREAYLMAAEVLEMAAHFGSRRIYSLCGAVCYRHHALPSRVLVTSSLVELTRTLSEFANAISISHEDYRQGGYIAGMNGLLLSYAIKQGLEAVSLMGEIPDYLANIPYPYPKATQALLEYLGRLFGVKLEDPAIPEVITQVDEVITNILARLPPEILERIEERRGGNKATITTEDQQWLVGNIDQLFKNKPKEDNDKT